MKGHILVVLRENHREGLRLLQANFPLSKESGPESRGRYKGSAENSYQGVKVREQSKEGEKWIRQLLGKFLI